VVLHWRPASRARRDASPDPNPGPNPHAHTLTLILTLTLVLILNLSVSLTLTLTLALNQAKSAVRPTAGYGRGSTLSSSRAAARSSDYQYTHRMSRARGKPYDKTTPKAVDD